MWRVGCHYDVTLPGERTVPKMKIYRIKGLICLRFLLISESMIACEQIPSTSSHQRAPLAVERAREWKTRNLPICPHVLTARKKKNTQFVVKFI